MVEESPGCTVHHVLATSLFNSCNGTRVMATLKRDPGSDAAAAPLGSQNIKKKKLEKYFY